MRAIPRSFAVATAAITAIAAFASPLGAQTDDEVLARFRLTEAGLVKFTQASRSFIAIAKADSAALEQQSSEDSDGMTIAQMAALYDGHPGLKRAITSAGMTSREFVTFLMSMFQAGMGAWLVEQQGGKFDKVPAGIPHENIRFYQQHRAALEAIGEEMKAVEGRNASDEEG